MSPAPGGPSRIRGSSAGRSGYQDPYALLFAARIRLT
jgi:hypothetical protein